MQIGSLSGVHPGQTVHAGSDRRHTRAFPAASRPLWFGLALVLPATTLVLIVAGLRAFFSFDFVEVRDDAMEPALAARSVAVIQHVAPTDFRVGDIVSFVPPDSTGRAISRRVVGFSSDHNLIVRSDATPSEDVQNVPAASVDGRYLFAVPEGIRYVVFGALLRPRSCRARS